MVVLAIFQIIISGLMIWDSVTYLKSGKNGAAFSTMAMAAVMLLCAAMNIFSV